MELEADCTRELRMRDKKCISKAQHLVDFKNYSATNRCEKYKFGGNMMILILVNLNLMRVAFQVSANI